MHFYGGLTTWRAPSLGFPQRLVRLCRKSSLGGFFARKKHPISIKGGRGPILAPYLEISMHNPHEKREKCRATQHTHHLRQICSPSLAHTVMAAAWLTHRRDRAQSGQKGPRSAEIPTERRSAARERPENPFFRGKSRDLDEMDADFGRHKWRLRS
ncbi:hypothetical protein TcasGA2_TC011314 [Tribolium castaneum]|uniref:Uncharacterized protein n=1 Tax=Tribolium castaneum TaxID=7070 RepID=D6X3X3_TRICA|nr:hypothetical protein TcasGA2_TC011314 [Tribolium castaneum]